MKIIIVLGNSDQSVMVTRLERGLEEFRRDPPVDSPIKAVLLLSGTRKETDFMNSYLLNKNIDASFIDVENQSRNTYENLINCKNIIKSKYERFYAPEIYICTSTFHIKRAMVMAYCIFGNYVHCIDTRETVSQSEVDRELFYLNSFLSFHLATVEQERDKIRRVWPL